MQTGMLGSLSKWDVVRDAIEQLLARAARGVRFGLSLYPGRDIGCTQGEPCLVGGPVAVFVDPGSATPTNITDALATAGICSYMGTPTGEALMSLADYAGLRDTTRSNYIVLLTDDPASCADPSSPAAALVARTPSVKTFVIGLGTDVDAAELRALAASGGTARAAPNEYYQVDTAGDLRLAFDDIILPMFCP
jgi:hypothetical protein